MNRGNSSDSIVVLLTDSAHPELKEIARVLTNTQRNYTLISGLLFTEKESRFLSRIFAQKTNLVRFLESHSLPIARKDLKRPMFLTECLYMGIYLAPSRFKGSVFNNLILLIDRFSKKIGSLYLQWIVRRLNVKLVLTQNTFNMANISSKVVKVEVAYHGDIAHEKYWHKYAVNSWPEWAHSWKIRNSFGLKEVKNNTDLIISSSSFAGNFFQENGHPVVTVPLGQRKVIGELIERKPSDFRRNFVFLGSFGLRKGLPVLLEASKFLREDSRLLIMGRTDDFATKLLLQKWDSHNLEIIDGPDRTEVLNQLSKADVFLFPSFYEGFGIAILEAMSFGCIPVVSRNTCGPDILKGTSFESFLFDAGDLVGFVESIRVLEELSTVQLRKLQAEARSVSEQYTFQNFGKNCVDFLFKNKYL